jgi:hypothetical protein
VFAFSPYLLKTNMKKLILLFLFYVCYVTTFSQDVIVTIENDSISAKVMKVYNSTVRFVPFSNQDSISYFISKTMIISIIYENGEIEIFNNFTDVANRKTNNIVVIRSDTRKSNNKEKNLFNNILKFDPLAVILSAALYQQLEFDLQFSRYLHPNIALPFEFDLVLGGDMEVAFALLTGIETVPLTHQQKSGLFLNALIGISGYKNNDIPPFFYAKNSMNIGTIFNANAGYQLVTKHGFVLNATIGAMYSSFTNKVALRYSLFIGIAF